MAEVTGLRMAREIIEVYWVELLEVTAFLQTRRMHSPCTFAPFTLCPSPLPPAWNADVMPGDRVALLLP